MFLELRIILEFFNFFFKKFMLILICFYKDFISPFCPKICRYYPSCSEYGILVISNKNSLKSVFLLVKRILKCNPFFQGGIDFPK